MTYIQYNDYYIKSILSGAYQNPYYLDMQAPNFSTIINYIPGCIDYTKCNSVDNAYYDDILYNNPLCNNIPDGYYRNMTNIMQDPSTVLNFTTARLVSNVPTFARVLDINLLNPWGIIVADDIVWVANSDSGLVTSYTLQGSPLTLFNVLGPFGNIAQPTGIAYNYNLESFMISRGPLHGSCGILVATRNGTVNGYNSSLDESNSAIIIDNTMNNAVYTGIAIVSSSRFTTLSNPNITVSNPFNYVYLTDFYNQKIDVYDGRIRKINTFLFIDEYSADPIPDDYAPYNIININNLLYVTYAKQQPDNSQYELLGSGFGFISIFNFDGTFVKRFASRGALNAPWSIVIAPSIFGYPSNSFLVSNYGDGLINVYDSEGRFINTLRDNSYNIICLGGLRGLTLNPNFNRALYWTSSQNDLLNFFMGSINVN